MVSLIPFLSFFSVVIKSPYFHEFDDCFIMYLIDRKRGFKLSIFDVDEIVQTDFCPNVVLLHA